MEFYVDGGCRNNGYDNAFGAAAACLMSRNHSFYWSRTQKLDTDDYAATNQRAEILAIIIALEWALEKYNNLDTQPNISVTIHSDSRYAVGCMSDWIYRWSRNGWQNSKGHRVANLDLIQKASRLDDEVQELGTVKYVYIPRSENQNADTECRELLDEIEQEDSYEADDFFCY